MDQPSWYIPQLLWGFPICPLQSYSHSLHSNVGSNKFLVLVYMYQEGGGDKYLYTKNRSNCKHHHLHHILDFPPWF